MCLKNNTLFTSNTALFDEAIFPKCNKKSHIPGITCLKEPKAQHSPLPADKDTTLGDFDKPETLPPTPNKKNAAPESDRTSSDSAGETPESVLPALPSAPEPVPLQRSAQLRKVPTRPGNIYRESRNLTQIEKDIRNK